MSSKNSVVVTDQLENELGALIATYPSDKLFMILDRNSERFCLPLLCDLPAIENFKKVVIPAGE
jgi:hypothetical protein